MATSSQRTSDKSTSCANNADENNQKSTAPHSSSIVSSATTEYFQSVVSMLSILSSGDQGHAHRALIAITNSPDSCQALRKAGCMSLLIQILHPVNLPPNEYPSAETKARAARALKNIVHFNPDENQKRKEMHVLKLLELIRTFSEQLRNHSDCTHPVQCITALMRLSFDDEHRLAMCQLGAIHALADLIQTEHSVHGVNLTQDCIYTRRYSGMTLTTLTFGDQTNKSLLCSMKKFMIALVAQLDCQNEDVCQVTASVLRNLSWHADKNSQAALRDSNVVSKLTAASIKCNKESTLNATLSALWNLSAHSSANKIAIGHAENGIEFLIRLLTYKSESLTIVEKAGGILRYVATIVAHDEIIRESFRNNGIIEILLEQLKSSSLVVVSNACSTLCDLSKNCLQDQKKLFELGALPKLKALMYSKHDGISKGASGAFHNILEYSNSEKNTSPNLDQQPMDLRRPVETPTALEFHPPISNLASQDEPLDLSMHSSKSSPIHVVSAIEFGTRPSTAPVFLNPPIQHTISIRKYSSPKNYNSCPELMRFIQPAHQTKPLDCSKSEILILEDTTTNYSLHFTDFTESEESPSNKNEDTIKTYYCEGTPLNFSTSNSMSDLTQVERPIKLKPIVETEAGEDQPKKYFTEHTPANFSRASSLSSLASASNIQGGENKAEYLEEQSPNLILPVTAIKEKVKRNVTFSANETPLIFSRSSSVNSLESFEMNYEDTGSVLSEFSRRTSEVVSPSDLPDSPRQLGSMSSRFQEKKQTEHEQDESDTIRVFTSGDSAPMTGVTSVRSLSPLTVDGELVGITREMDSPPELQQSKPMMVTKPILKHIHLDELRVFAIEGTPFGVSNSTSLSDLVCDLDLDKETEMGPLPNKIETVPEKPLSLKVTSTDEPESKPLLSDQEDEPIYSDAQVLLKCIKAGKASRIPKSKSEVSQLNIVPEGIKNSTSYHEDLRFDEVDPDLAALIMKGKNKARNLVKQNSNPQITQDEHIPSEVERNAIIAEPNQLIKSKQLLQLQLQNKPSGESQVGIEKPSTNKTNQAAKIKALNQSITSVISVASEWNDETPTISSTIPSMSISTAFRLVEAKASSNLDDVNVESTLTAVQPPSAFSALISSTECKRKTYTKSDNVSNLFNQKPPPEFDLENSMISIASLKSEVASTVDMIEAGMHDLSLGVETYTIDGSCDGTDCDDSFNETESFGEIKNLRDDGEKSIDTKASPTDRFLTFTRSHSSPKQKRHDDPTRYLTRTITPVDANGNSSSPTNQFATFKVEKSTRIAKPIAATSNDSSPSASPKGIRGRRKHLYASLPPQRKIAPPIPPKPRTPISSISNVFVRPTRSSELRAALSSRESSPKHSKQSSRNSSQTSLNMPQQIPTRKIPPKPPVRTSVPSKNFAVVRAVRNSSSSIGFNDDSNPKQMEPAFNTLPRSSKATENSSGSKEKEQTKVGKLSHFWNQFLTRTKSKSGNVNNVKQSAGNGYGAEVDERKGHENKTSRFGIGFGFGKKKKDIWVKRENDSGITEKVEREKAFVLPFNYTHHPPTGNGSNPATTSATSNSKMTTV